MRLERQCGGQVHQPEGPDEEAAGSDRPLSPTSRPSSARSREGGPARRTGGGCRHRRRDPDERGLGRRDGSSPRARTTTRRAQAAAVPTSGRLPTTTSRRRSSPPRRSRRRLPRSLTRAGRSAPATPTTGAPRRQHVDRARAVRRPPRHPTSTDRLWRPADRQRRRAAVVVHLRRRVRREGPRPQQVDRPADGRRRLPLGAASASRTAPTTSRCPGGTLTPHRRTDGLVLPVSRSPALPDAVHERHGVDLSALHPDRRPVRSPRQGLRRYDAQGLQSSFWLYPAQLTYGAWPASGEIDIAEMFSQYPTLAIPYVHYNNSFSDRDATNDNCVIGDPSQFHTYAVEWTPQSLTFLYDGAHVPGRPLERRLAADRSGAPSTSPSIICLTQALGIGTRTSSSPARPRCPPRPPSTGSGSGARRRHKPPGRRPKAGHRLVPTDSQKTTKGPQTPVGRAE